MSSCRGDRSATWIFVACFIATGITATTNAQDLLGAKAAMQRIREHSKNEETTANATDLEKTIRDLPKLLETLAPADAALAWIDVYEEWAATPQDVRTGQAQLDFSALIDVLPTPEAWPDLVQLIEARPIKGNDESKLRALGLRMLGHRLIQQKDLLKQDIEQALKIIDPGEKAKKKGLGALLGRLFQVPEEPDYRVEEWLAQVMVVKAELDPKSAVDDFHSQLAAQKGQFHGYVSVPDLVQLAGSEEATKLIESALLLKNVTLNFNSAVSDSGQENETIKLARELARKHLKELSQPHWELCQSIDAIDLFEAFSDMPKGEGLSFSFGSEKETASVWYITGLIVRDRTQDVLKFLTEAQEDDKASRKRHFLTTHLRYSILPQLERAGHARKVHAFLSNVLKTHPELPLWEIFLESSAKQGQSKEVLLMVEAAIANECVTPATRRHLEKIRADALLAADRVEDGVAQTLTLLAEVDQPDDKYSDRSRLNLALRVAEIGRLLERADWISQGSDIAESLLTKSPQYGNLDEFIGLLIELKQFARAERLAVDDLTNAIAEETKEAGVQGHHTNGLLNHVAATRILKLNHVAAAGVDFEEVVQDFSMTSRALGNNASLQNLIRVYHAAGRADDVMALLEEAPWWSQTNIGEMMSVNQYGSAGHGERALLPIPLIAAKSLAALGRKDEARQIAEAMVLHWPTFDAGWELALELTGDDFVPLAEKVFARDHFEERPLIWLAQYHLNQGNLAKAEELAKQAITIDPSDGEQGRGDRMRVYAVLAEVLKKNGDTKTATVYEGAVKAIRLSEDADQFYHAGMLSRGIRMYRTSLTHFADAYCIQSRLAVQLAETGDFEGAARHYQRAFELMPDSFGRVESHCFGCEGVFKGPIAEKIAERVFVKLVADQPENPRVHYLLGYLREAESRHSSALKSFKEAVRLDPDYLNAWQKLLTSADSVEGAITPEERDHATFQILRLDPLGLHATSDISKVQDLSRLWKVLHENARRVPKLDSQPLLQLKAAKLAQAKLNAEANFTPAQAATDAETQFSSHKILTAISNLIQNSETFDMPMGIQF